MCQVIFQILWDKSPTGVEPYFSEEKQTIYRGKHMSKEDVKWC